VTAFHGLMVWPQHHARLGTDGVKKREAGTMLAPPSISRNGGPANRARRDNAFAVHDRNAREWPPMCQVPAVARS
jgi:hypothetical protein